MCGVKNERREKLKVQTNSIYMSIFRTSLFKFGDQLVCEIAEENLQTKLQTFANGSPLCMTETHMR
jgi:hypothetical protein